jgi:hypothetical protein
MCYHLQKSRPVYWDIHSFTAVEEQCVPVAVKGNNGGFLQRNGSWNSGLWRLHDCLEPKDIVLGSSIE